MTFICARCLKVKDTPNPPGYEKMDIIDKFNAWRGMDHAICAECVRKLLAKEVKE